MPLLRADPPKVLEIHHERYQSRTQVVGQPENLEDSGGQIAQPTVEESEPTPEELREAALFLRRQKKRKSPIKQEVKDESVKQEIKDEYDEAYYLNGDSERATASVMTDKLIESQQQTIAAQSAALEACAYYHSAYSGLLANIIGASKLG